jgi:hypothetical protein
MLIKNLTSNDIILNDSLSVTIPGSSTYDLTTLDPELIRESMELIENIIDNNLIFNDPLTGYDLEENECMTLIFGTLILINNTAANIEITDVGFTIPANKNYNISLKKVTAIRESNVTVEHIRNGTLSLSNGLALIPTIEAIRQLTAVQGSIKVKYDERYYTEPEIDTMVGDINTDITNLENGDFNNNLNEAYNQDANKTIIINNGPIVLDASSGTNASIEMTNVDTPPSTNLGTEPQLQFIKGILCVWDHVRGKWLSVDRKYVTFGRKGTSPSMYLSHYGGSIPSNNSGIRMIRDATIISMSGQLKTGSGDCDISVRKGNGPLNIATLTLDGVLGYGIDDLDIDVDQGEYLQSYIQTLTYTNDPMVVVEIAWRMS